MPIPPPRRRKPRAPAAVPDTPMTSSLADMTGQAPPPSSTANAAEPWQGAYRDLHDRN